MIVAGIVKSSLIDYPGHISCVLFAPGCNYDCFYCHNRPLVDGPYAATAHGELLDFLKKRAGQLDGVVVTGGEPTLQPDLADFLGGLKRLGYQVKLDTNGSNPAVVENVITAGLADYFAVDYKAPAGRYKELCAGAADAQAVLETIRLLKDRDADFEVRTTVVPQLGEDDLMQMARELPEVPRWTLNRYRKPEVYLPRDADKVDQIPYTAEQLGAFAETLRKWQPNTVF
jgi:pyruvate formate lyase activating enzyme